MRTYFDFVVAPLSELGEFGNADGPGFAAGDKLAEKCCTELLSKPDADRFPPQLLILLVTPDFVTDEQAQEIVPGINARFRHRFGTEVPLIGSSVSAVFCGGKVHPKGAVLICLASLPSQFSAKVASAPAARLEADPKAAIKQLVKSLELDVERGDINPRGNRKLLTFFPGHLPEYLPVKLHRMLSQEMAHRLHTTGGVSHSVPPKRGPGLQFTKYGPDRGALVVALIEFEVPVGSGLGWGLQGTGNFFDIENPEDDAKLLLRPVKGRPNRYAEAVTRDLLVEETGFCVLGHQMEHRYIGEVVYERGDRGARPLRDATLENRVELLDANPEFISNSIERTVKDPRLRIGMKKPAGAVGFFCNSFLRYAGDIKLNIEAVLGSMAKELDGQPVAGGFFDGEVGVDHDGHSMLANWSAATLTFGDELKDRAVLLRGFAAIAQHSAELNRAETVQSVIEASLKMLEDIPYLGAMVWLAMADGDSNWIVPQTATAFGPRLKELAACSLSSKEYPACLLSDKSSTASYHPDLSKWNSGLVSQYLKPLRWPNASSSSSNLPIIGMLQVDLGDTRSSKELRASECRVLESLAAATESALARVYTLQESRILHALDESRNKALAAPSVEIGREIMIKSAVEAFDIDCGYVRVVAGDRLKAVAGVGKYFNLIKDDLRSEVLTTDQGPTGRAWAERKCRILNQAQDDEGFQGLSQRQLSDVPGQVQDELADALKEVGSVGVAVMKDYTNTRTGTIILQANRIWAFYDYHVRCLDALAVRLGNIIGYLEKRVATDFLLQVGGGQTDARNLKRLVENFRKAAKAKVVSLFVLEQGIDRFVLCAQSGWRDERWHNVASYEKTEGFTGSVGMDTKIYYGCLQKYRQDTGISDSEPYHGAMFGDREIKEIRALGLPFSHAGEPFGVLTAFWFEDPETDPENSPENNPFGTVGVLSPRDTDLLRQYAAQTSDYVRARLDERSARRAAQARDRCGEIAAARIGQNKGGEALCRIVGKAYGASKVALFMLRKHEANANSNAPQVSGTIPPHQGVLELVGAWSEHGTSTFEPPEMEGKRWVIQRKKEDAVNRGDPLLAAGFGAPVIASITVPTDSEAGTGILEMHWDNPFRRADHVLNAASENLELELLSQTVGWAYQRHIARRGWDRQYDTLKQFTEHQSARIESMLWSAKTALHDAVQAAPVQLLKLKDLIKARDPNVSDHLCAIEGAVEAITANIQSSQSTGALDDDAVVELRRTARQLNLRFPQLRASIDTSDPGTSEQLERIASVIAEIQDSIRLILEPLNPCPHNTARLIRIAVEKITKLYPDLRGRVNILVPESIWMRADQNRAVAAFKNLIHNGKRAVAKRGFGQVTVTAAPFENDVQIAFEDTGVGIPPDKVADLNLGRAPEIPEGLGLGIPIARSFIKEQKGDLTVESVEGSGTCIVVTLPLLEVEEA